MGRQSGLDRNPQDLAADIGEVEVPVDQHRLEAALEHRAMAPMAPVEGPPVKAREAPHAFRQARPPGLDHQLEMIRQEAIGHHRPIEAAADLSEDGQESLGVFRVVKQLAAALTLRADVVERAGKLDALGPCHAWRLAK